MFETESLAAWRFVGLRRAVDCVLMAAVFQARLSRARRQAPYRTQVTLIAAAACRMAAPPCTRRP